MFIESILSVSLLKLCHPCRTSFAPPTWFFSQAHPGGVSVFSTVASSLMWTTFSAAQWMEASKNSIRNMTILSFLCMLSVTAYHNVQLCNIPMCFDTECSFSHGTKICFLFSHWLFCSNTVVLRVMASSGNVRVIQSLSSKNALCHKRPLNSLQLSAMSFRGGHYPFSFVRLKLPVAFAFWHNASIIVIKTNTWFYCYYYYHYH